MKSNLDTLLKLQSILKEVTWHPNAQMDDLIQEAKEFLREEIESEKQNLKAENEADLKELFFCLEPAF